MVKQMDLLSLRAEASHFNVNGDTPWSYFDMSESDKEFAPAILKDIAEEFDGNGSYKETRHRITDSMFKHFNRLLSMIEMEAEDEKSSFAPENRFF